MLVDKTMRRKKAKPNSSSSYETHRFTATSETLKVSVLGSPPANVHVHRQEGASRQKPRSGPSNTTFKFVPVSHDSDTAKAQRSAKTKGGDRKSSRFPGKRVSRLKDAKADERLKGLKEINGSPRATQRASQQDQNPLMAVRGSSKSLYGYGTGMDAAASAFLPFCEQAYPSCCHSLTYNRSRNDLHSVSDTRVHATGI
jgi:hypothetical protein